MTRPDMRPDEIGLWPAIAGLAAGVFLIAVGNILRAFDDNLAELGDE